MIRRQVRYLGKTRPDMAPGCVERLDRGALDFFLWVWRTRRSQHRRIAELAATADGQGCAVIRLASRRNVAAFVGAVEEGGWRAALPVRHAAPGAIGAEFTDRA